MAKTKVLILGGTGKARELVRQAIPMFDSTAEFISSQAGVTQDPIAIPGRMVTGGFGGITGLAEFMDHEQIQILIDATHPFAAQMSMNAVAACAQTNAKLLALTRPKWVAQTGDQWRHVADINSAVAVLSGTVQNVMLAIGRMHLDAFAPCPQHQYLLRVVDAPSGEVPLPNRSIIVDQGPFSVENDIALMRDHKIELVVAKNAGGSGARAKIDAARALNIPIIMIDRPYIPARPEVGTAQEVLDWLAHLASDLGV